jgi:hypothetical protein
MHIIYIYTHTHTHTHTHTRASIYIYMRERARAREREREARGGWGGLEVVEISFRQILVHGFEVGRIADHYRDFVYYCVRLRVVRPSLI